MVSGRNKEGCSTCGRRPSQACARVAALERGPGAVPLLPCLPFGAPELDAPSAASTRWRITDLPFRPPLPHTPDVPGLGRPVWHLDLLRWRGAQAATIFVEARDAQGRLALPSYLADRPAAPHCRRSGPWSRGRMTAGG